MSRFINKIFINKILHPSQLQRIIIGMIFGILIGFTFKEKAAPLEYFGILFLNMLKMVTIPLIFFTIVYGITNTENPENLLHISRKAIFMFMITALLAVCIGFAIANIMKPGVGADISILNNSIYTADAQQLEHQQNEFQNKSIVEELINLVPTNIFSALVNGNIIQIILFAFFIGSILNIKRQSCKELITIFHQITIVLLEMIKYIMYIAPIAVFGYISAMIGSGGMVIIEILLKLIFSIILGCIVQYIIFGLMILFYAKLNPIPFYRKIIGVQIIAFTTSSSKATLAQLMKLGEEELGISEQSTKFVLPLSAALNMDGGAIYQATCAIFFSQMMGVDLSFSNYITLLLMCTLASIGGAGIPGGVLLFLGMVLQSVGLPIEGVLIIASVDRILDMITTTLNVTGDICVTLLLDRSEKRLNEKIYYSNSNDKSK